MVSRERWQRGKVLAACRFPGAPGLWLELRLNPLWWFLVPHVAVNLGFKLPGGLSHATQHQEPRPMLQTHFTLVSKPRIKN